jgi:dienelactone hydrolase
VSSPSHEPVAPSGPAGKASPAGPGADPKSGHHYQHLGRFSDWIEFARWQALSFEQPKSAKLTPELVRETLGFAKHVVPGAARTERTWLSDGVAGEEVSWSVGYGPRTRAWVLRPAGAKGRLPGVVALHDHGGFKFYGKEKIADGPEPPDQVVVELRSHSYGGRAFANELARAGFAVLAHDVFLWGSRRFDYEEMVPPKMTSAGTGSPAEAPPGEAPPAEAPPAEAPPGEAPAAGTGQDVLPGGAESISIYNEAAGLHEHVVAKYCTLLGTSLAGVVAYEDRVALEYLRSRPDVISERVGCVGLSGGGCRAALMQATAPALAVSVIAGMMSTYDRLLDRHVSCHTWMFFPPGLVSLGDWPDLAACRAPAPLVVQYCRDDELFPLNGMVEAHEHIAAAYSTTGAPENYVGEFYDGGHRFDQPMQDAAFGHLGRWCAP